MSSKSLFHNTLPLSHTRSILYTENIAKLKKLRIFGGGTPSAPHSGFQGSRRLFHLTSLSALALEFACTLLRPIGLRVCSFLLEAFVMATLEQKAPAVGASKATVHKNFIGGEWVESHTDRKSTRLN